MADDADLPPDLDQARARLYAEPLADFVAARDGLVKALRAADRAADAKAVKALRKPSRPAWILDAGFRADPDGTERLAAAVNDVIEAQAGRGDMRDATRGLRDAAQAVAKAAGDAAKEAGVNIDRSTLVPAVLAVVADPVAFAELRQGQLAELPTAGALDVLTDPPPLLPVSPSSLVKEAPPAPSPPPVDLAERRKAREAVAAAEKAATDARRTADEADEAVTAARAAVEAAEKAFRQAESDVKSARQALHDAQQQAKSLRATARDTDRALSQARKRSPTD